MRGADAEHNPGPRARSVFAADRGERFGGYVQIGLGARQRHVHCRHQRAQPVDRLVVEMAGVDAGIGDEETLRAEPKPDTLGNAGEFRGERRAQRAIEDPQRSEFFFPQQGDETNEIEAALQLRA